MNYRTGVVTRRDPTHAKEKSFKRAEPDKTEIPLTYKIPLRATLSFCLALP